jgi:hypothetical protein
MPRTAAERNREIMDGTYQEEPEYRPRSWIEYLTIDGYRQLPVENLRVYFNHNSAYVNDISFTYQYDET